MAVYIDVVLARVMLLSTGAAALTLAAGSVVVGIRLFTSLAIPGWASQVALSLAIVFVQALSMSFLLLLLSHLSHTQPVVDPNEESRKALLPPS
jgi:hypothetical protein